MKEHALKEVVLAASKSFQVLSNLNKNIGHGGIICFREEDIPLTSEIDVIPIRYL